MQGRDSATDTRTKYQQARTGCTSKDPGVLDPGILGKDPGVLSKDPVVLLKDPGALLKDPGVFENDPGPLQKHSGVL